MSLKATGKNTLHEVQEENAQFESLTAFFYLLGIVKFRSVKIAEIKFNNIKKYAKF